MLTRLRTLLAAIKKARAALALEAEIQQDAQERKSIAKAFNNRYTYRHEYAIDMPRLPGTAMGGITPPGGYAWMCPECNRIHYPTSSSVFSGLQYPGCCTTDAGHRLTRDIKTRS